MGFYDLLIGGYVIGVVVGLAIMRDPWPERVRTAAFWPLGPLAFGVVVVVLLLAAAYLWPLPVVGTAALVSALVWLVGS